MDDHMLLGTSSASQASLHSHSAAPVAAALTKSTLAGGGHVAALRSLGLLHELKEYVAACVETTQKQEKELGKLKAEKKEVERVLKQKALRGPEKQQYVQQFQASEISDLPPRLRALFEDNKVLKEQSRRYKQRLQEAERHAASVEQQLLAAQAANGRLKVQLQEGHAGDGGLDVAAEAVQARQQAEGLQKALEKLQHAHQVLQQKLDTDARLHRHALATASKEHQQLEQQVHELQEQLRGKNKEARSHALTAKQAQRRLEEVKSSSAKAVAGVNARVAEAVAAVEAQHKEAADARVHLMLCVLHEPRESSSLRPHHAARQQLQAAQQSHEQQGGGGGLLANESSGYETGGAAGSSSSFRTREQAVLRLQAGARGYLTRKQLRLQRQEQDQALVLVQTGQPPQQQEAPANQAAASGAAGDGGDAGSSRGPSDSSSVSLVGGSSSSPAGEPQQQQSVGLGGFSLPMELPALLGDAPANAACAAAGAASHAAARHPVPAVPAAVAGHGATRRAGRQPASAAAAAAASPVVPRKPPLPSFSRCPPASAPRTATSSNTKSSPGSNAAAKMSGGRGGVSSATSAAVQSNALGSATRERQRQPHPPNTPPVHRQRVQGSSPPASLF